MVKYYDLEIDNKEDWMELMAQYLSGSCMNSVPSMFEYDDFLVGIKEFGITEEEFCNYIDCAGIFQCDTCGWWTYSGEGDGTDCDDCVDDKNEEEE